MDIRAVKKQIKGGQLDRLYLFTGDELEAQRIYINKMAEVTGRAVCRLETVSEVIKQKSGLIKVPTLYVVRDDTDFIKAENAWDDITDALGDKMLILQLTTVDKRTKFYKRFSEQIVTFNYMDAEVLHKYVQRECPLQADRAEQLIHVCGNSYGRLLLEADKINQYAKRENISVDVAFDKLIADGAIYEPPEDAIFDFVDAVLQAKPNKAFKLLDECRAIGEPSIKLLSVLYSSAKRVLQVQVCNSKDISKSTGLVAWEINLARKNLNYWSGEDLVYFLKLIQSIEKGIKTGEIEESVAVDVALTMMF